MATYYVKVNGGTGSGLTDADAWSYAKLNSMNYGGNTILFKRGEVFKGVLVVKSGSSGNPTIFNAYGTGDNPIIDGFTNLTSWTLASTGVYYATLDTTIVNSVSVDGVTKAIGRYPKNDYLVYTGHTANTAISGVTVGAIPFDPTGAQVVIRKLRFVLDRHIVTSRSGNTLNYSLVSFSGNNAYQPQDGNGYFLQNHLSCVTQEGDWFYDATAKRFYMHFGAVNPNTRTVKVSTVNYLVPLDDVSYIDFENIDFEGGERALSNNNTNYINVKKSNFRKQGNNAIYGLNSQNINVSLCNTEDSQNLSIMFEANCNAISVYDNDVKRAGIIAGAGQANSLSYSGIAVNGLGNVIVRNKVTNCGYNGISSDGNPLIENNLVDTFCTVKDDGGGIYTYVGENAVINKNIVLNAIGAYAGCGAYFYEPFGKAAGVYVDDGQLVKNTTVTNNFIANGEWGGIVVNNNAGSIVEDNTCFNHQYQLLLLDFSKKIRSTSIKRNIFIAKTELQKCFHIEIGEVDTLSLLGDFNNNVYARPIEDGKTFEIYRNYGAITRELLSLSEWKTLSSLDALSVKSSVIISSSNLFDVFTNPTLSTSSVTLIIPYLDVENVVYKNSMELTPFSGMVLIENKKLFYKTPSGNILSHNGKILTRNV